MGWSKVMGKRKKGSGSDNNEPAEVLEALNTVDSIVEVLDEIKCVFSGPDHLINNTGPATTLVQTIQSTGLD
ncbi:hypothetical protein R1flu_003724 [Riccia fluitans]|uniref:Uncharacterized protein n=1 Tax=Riccia fluitans TaxID=41844 RepID=A0ABD1Y9T0_9MARC